MVERIAIDSGRELITYLGNDDPTSRRMFEGILAVDGEHAGDLPACWRIWAETEMEGGGV